MTINLTPWFILWALVTSVVVALAFWRLMMGLHELGGIHISKASEHELEHEIHATQTIARIERWGKGLTVVSIMLILGIWLAWVFSQL